MLAAGKCRAYDLFLSRECKEEEEEEDDDGKGGGTSRFPGSPVRDVKESKEVPWNRSGFYFVRVCLPLGLRSRP